MMKQLLFTFFLLILACISFAQPKQKPPKQDKAPTQKEMADMMKEMQEAMDEISPEDKKMMDSMGIKMPDTKSIQKSMSGITDAQLQKAYEDANRIVPMRDAARIAAIPKGVNASRMGAYIASIQSKAEALVKPELKKMGDKIYSYIKSISKNSTEAGNMAIGLWIAGKPELAFYTLGKICINDAVNTDKLSNYASMLSMLDAQNLAIPILNNLNVKFPKNSTLLNNLGQAWFGLGEINKAEKYLDSAIRIYAYHPQANYTKSFIEESKGNIPKAIEAVKKSIRKAYSTEKENKLKKLGYTLKPDDIDWDLPMPQDALGLGKFNWPEYPLDVEQNKLLEKEWKDFKNECQQKINELKIKQTRLEQEYLTQSTLRTQHILQAGQKGQYVQMMPVYAAKAIKKLGPGVNDVNGNVSFVFAKELGAVTKALIAVGGYEKILNEKQLLLDKKYEDQVGEGKPNPFEAICKDENAISTEFLLAANGGLQSAYRSYLNYVRRRTSDLLYYYQYTMWPEQFELAKVSAQIAWLTQIKDQRVFFKDKSSWCTSVPKTKKPGTLQKFDDVACQYNATMDLKIIKFTNNCSRMTSEFDFMFLNYVRKDDFERAEGDTYISSTIKISAEAGKDLKAGPLKVEAKVGAGVELEFGRGGLEDVTLIGEAKVGAGTGIFDEDEKSGSPGIGIAGKDAFPTTVEAGVEGRISIITGKGSVSGTGVLKDIKMAEW